MSVAGYEKVKTKVIEGKKKCIYKKYKGTKLYVKGFGKMRSVESYIKLCKKSAAAKAAKAAKATKASKPTKAKKARSKSTKKYGGFLQELFSTMDGDNFANDDDKKKGADKFTTSSMMTVAADTKPASQAAHASKDTFATPPSSHPPAKTGGSNCSRQGGYRGGNGMMTGLSQDLSQGLSAFTGAGGYRGGNVVDQFKDDVSEQFQDQSQSQDGGRRRKRNRAAKSMLDKLMMAATFRKRSAKKGKKLHRKGGNLVAQATDAFGNLIGGKRKAKKGKGKKGGSSQNDY
jgi:hypothetical protein